MRQRSANWSIKGKAAVPRRISGMDALPRAIHALYDGIRLDMATT